MARHPFVLGSLRRALAALFLGFALTMAVSPEARGGEEEAGGVRQSDSMMGLPSILDLRTAQERALAENPTLQAAAARVAQVKQRVKEVRSLYFPQVGAQYTWTSTWLPDRYLDEAEALLDEAESTVRRLRDSWPDATALPPTLTTWESLRAAHDARNAKREFRDIERGLNDLEEDLDGRFDTYNLTFTAGWLLFDGLSREFSYAAARFGSKEADAARLEAQRLILDAVAKSYHGAQLAREGVRIAEANVTFIEDLVGQTKKRYETGKASRSDLLNFRVRQHAAHALLLRARGEHQAARVALGTLLNLPDGLLPEGVQVAEFAPENPEDLSGPEAEAVLAYALEHRPTLRQSSYGVKRAKAMVKQRYAAYSPRVSLFGSVSAQRIDTSSFEPEDLTSSVGLNVSIDLFTGLRRHAQVVAAKYECREAEYRLRGEEQKVIGEVQRALIDLVTVQEELRLQRAAAADVAENREIENRAYEVGKGALVRLNQAQRDLVEAQGKLALAQVSLRQAWHELHSATAETLADFGLGVPREYGDSPVLNTVSTEENKP